MRKTDWLTYELLRSFLQQNASGRYHKRMGVHLEIDKVIYKELVK